MFQFEVPLCPPPLPSLGDYSSTSRCIIAWGSGTEARMDYLQMWTCGHVDIYIYRRYCYDRRYMYIWKIDLHAYV